MILSDLGTVLDAGNTALIASHGGLTGEMQTQARMWALRERKAGSVERGENGRPQLERVWGGEEAD